MAACLPTFAQVPDARVYQQMEEFPFVIVSEDCTLPPPEISDSLFDAAARGIRFRVNRTELQPNDPFIPLYNERLVPWLKQHDMQLRQVYVKGAASPEGPYQNNVRLSRARTQRLIDFLNAGLGQTIKVPISASSVTEDYALLVKMMGQAGDADHERVRQLWLDCGGDEACCKKRLMALDGGKVWARLLKQYFPALRQARVVLWFTRKMEASVKPVPIQTDVVENKAEEELPQVAELVVAKPEESAGMMAVAQQPVRYMRRHLIALRTNLVHDLLYVPQFGFAPGVNVQLEYYPLRGHFTLNAGYTHTTHRHWNDYKFFQIRDLQIELRRYFKGGGKFIGPYLSLYGEGAKYGIGFSETKGWQGEGGGGGLSVGYTCRLNRKGSLRLELSASVGVFVTRYDPYIYNHPFVGHDDGLYYYDYYGNAANFQRRNYRFVWYGPTNAGLHLTYDIVYRKKRPVGYYDRKGGGK